MQEALSRMMQDREIRSAFGARLKALRKQQRLTQKELATQLGIRTAQLNKYESGMHAPPVEKLIQLAEIFDTTTDYLLLGEQPDERPLHNKRLLDRFRELEDFGAEDQETVITLIDAMIVKRRVEGALNVERKAS